MLLKMKQGFLLFMGMFFLHTVNAQRVYDTTTTNIMLEISQVQAYLQTSTDLGFNAVYYFEDFDGEVSHYDTMQASYLINENKYHILLDSVETIQNDKYLVSVYTNDSLVVVQDPVEPTRQILQVDVMDSTFQQLALSSMTAADSGSFRKILLHFDEDALYKNYELVYNSNSYQILYIKYSLRKDFDVEIQRSINLFIQFSGFINEMPVGDPFSTDPYMRVINSNEIKTGSLTMNYEVVNMLQK